MNKAIPSVLLAVSPMIGGAARRRRRRRTGLIAAGLRGLLSVITRAGQSFTGAFGGGLGSAA